MPSEMTELEHIEMKLVDGMPIEYWRGVEDGLSMDSELIRLHERKGSSLDGMALTRQIEVALSQLRDVRTFWVMRMVPADLFGKEEGEGGSRPIGVECEAP